MKLAVGIIVFIWLFCGLVGAWWMDDFDLDHWKEIAWGPYTLAEALQDQPVTYPGPS